MQVKQFCKKADWTGREPGGGRQRQREGTGSEGKKGMDMRKKMDRKGKVIGSGVNSRQGRSKRLHRSILLPCLSVLLVCD